MSLAQKMTALDYKNNLILRTPSGILRVPVSEFSRSRWKSGLKAQKVASLAGVPCPKVMQVYSSFRNSGFPAKLESYEGVSIHEQKLGDLNQKDQIIKSFAKVLSQLHSITAENFSESLVSKGHSFAEVLQRRIRKTQKTVKLNMRQRRLFKEFCERVKHYPEVKIASLCHFDLKWDNFLWNTKKQKIVIIDFENARFYDPVWDLAMVKLKMFKSSFEFNRFLKEYQNNLTGTRVDLNNFKFRLETALLYEKIFL